MGYDGALFLGSVFGALLGLMMGLLVGNLAGNSIIGLATFLIFFIGCPVYACILVYRKEKMWREDPSRVIKELLKSLDVKE